MRQLLFAHDPHPTVPRALYGAGTANACNAWSLSIKDVSFLYLQVVGCDDSGPVPPK